MASFIVAAFGDSGRVLLRYDRSLIAAGDLWRLVSGHVTHLGQTHLLLNLAGLLLVWLLVGRLYSSFQWLVIAVITVITINAGFCFVDTQLIWYAGLSGMLHGLLVAGAIRGMRGMPVDAAIMIAIVAGKLAWEQFVGPLPGSESTSGGAVVVNSHLYGAVGGCLGALAMWRSVG